MPTHNKNYWIVGSVLLVILFLVVVSRFVGSRDGQEIQPLQEQASPEIPPEIKTEENQEPVLQVYISEEGSVRSMDFEEYIKGVVAGEMKPDWPETALAAQAIIARSFTLQKIEENGGVPQRNAHASTDIEEFQAYDAEAITENVEKAVEMTRGEVVVHQGNFIRGWFHAFAGPQTALADEGLAFKGGNPPYIHVVRSPATDIVPQEEKDWDESFSLEQIRSAVQEVTGEDPGPITEFEIVEKGPSGRVTLFRANDTEVVAPDLRLALGSTEMRSTFINEMDISGNEVTFSGTGFGHGVGMCQWGARAHADDGLSPEEIVRYYYKDVDIVKLWD
ncbi:SpoIID/LytB domain-containing protein [Candidatus Contubernalis alkaliaceticus]|uniref:SpoIID/LytB domain-containing protein n=1 Tax=Candidatus Contubernalis alkaliaceticus TaxID=338645 RepID=UPI001F4BE387|nr:SpoIID/LytB domain-containing protein [Candidatus Contubernalis alkalaceticus]UNC93741.1 SpoIID/LytB domain-containing protein [Candidatus Contubernalis alkalaceticus]